MRRERHKRCLSIWLFFSSLGGFFLSFIQVFSAITLVVVYFLDNVSHWWFILPGAQGLLAILTAISAILAVLTRRGDTFKHLKCLIFMSTLLFIVNLGLGIILFLFIEKVESEGECFSTRCLYNNIFFSKDTIQTGRVLGYLFSTSSSLFLSDILMGCYAYIHPDGLIRLPSVTETGRSDLQLIIQDSNSKNDSSSSSNTPVKDSERNGLLEEKKGYSALMLDISDIPALDRSESAKKQM